MQNSEINNRKLDYITTVFDTLDDLWYVYHYKVNDVLISRVDICHTFNKIQIMELQKYLSIPDYTIYVPTLSSDPNNDFFAIPSECLAECLRICNRFYFWKRLQNLFELINSSAKNFDLKDKRYVSKLKVGFSHISKGAIYTNFAGHTPKICKSTIKKLNGIYAKYNKNRQ